MGDRALDFIMIIDLSQMEKNKSTLDQKKQYHIIGLLLQLYLFVLITSP